MAYMPCPGQAHPLPGALHPAPSPTSFGRQLSGVRRLRLGRRTEQSRRLAPCGAWAGESWSRAFAAARSRARQFLQDQQQHFQREDADEAASQVQPAGSADQHSSSRGSARPAARPPAGEQLPEGDSGREQALAGGAQPHEAAAEQLSPEDADWEDWRAYMEASDAAGQELNDLDDELEAAAAEERYADAAGIKARMTALSENDVAGGLMVQMDELLENERYAEAATLRDEAATSMLGWFVGRGEDDPHGHLLRVGAAYNRYMGHAFSARDISEAKVAVDTGRVTPEEAGSAMEGAGVPMMELFLRKAPNGELQRKLVAVRGTPVEEKSLGQQVVASIEALDGLDGSAVVKVERNPLDGQVKVTLDLSGGPVSGAADSDAPEATDDDPSSFLESMGFGALGGMGGFELVGPGGDPGAVVSGETGFEGLGGDSESQQTQMQLSGTVMRLDRVPAEIRSIGRDTFSIHIPAPEESTEEGADSEEGPAVEPLAGPTADDEKLVAASGNAKAASTTLPELLQKMAKSGGKMVPDAEQMKQILAGIAGQLDQQTTPALLSLSGNVQYWRLPEGLPATDPFNGMYLANYGSHGPELLRLYREVVDDEELVIAKKLTGDPNVPAGEVTFRSKVARRHRVEHRDTYPPEFGVTARYKAEGQIAGPSFSDRRWVPGELLVFSGNSPLVGPCTLGFLWNIPGQRQFLVPLHRCDLN